jgi:hypothetical protein
MQQEATLVGSDASPVLQPVFQQRQRAWPTSIRIPQIKQVM